MSPWTLALLGIGAATILGSLVLNLIWMGRGGSYPRSRPLRPLRTTLLLCVLLLGGIEVAGALRGRHGAPFQVPAGHLGGPGRARATSPAFQFPLWAQLSAAVLLLAVGVLVAIAFGRPWRATDGPALPTLAPKLTDAIDRSLEDLETDPDARRAIIAAYRRMEESLAYVGLPRAGSETAREYLSRGLASLELSPGAIGTLTTLFERAKFSLRHVDLRLRDEAIASLRALQEELAGA